MESILHPQKPYTFKCQFPKDMFLRLCDDLLNNIYIYSGLNLETQYRRPILASNILSTPVILRQRIYLKTTELFTAVIRETLNMKSALKMKKI